MSKRSLYVALGDSFTAGVSGFDPAATWSASVARWLSASGAIEEFLNLASPGVSSGHVRATQLPRGIALAPRVVTLCCGANDVLLTPRPDFERLEDNIAAILEALKRIESCALVASLTYPDCSQTVRYRPRSRTRVVDGLRRLNHTTREISAEFGVMCVDLSSVNEQQSFSDDGMHPSPHGHRCVAKVVVGAFERELEAAAAPGVD